MINKKALQSLFLKASLLGFLGICHVPQVFAGVIDDTYKYAWSENIGWIIFKTPGHGEQVVVTNQKITGYIWSPTYGWINLQPAQGGVTNDNTGNIGGTAWGDNLGWIDFDGATIDRDGFFWGYLNGSVIGRTSLNCGNTNSCAVFDFKVKTDWTPAQGTIIGESGLNAPEKYAYGPDQLRDEFRDHYDSGTTLVTFDQEYKKSLEHAMQIDMGVQGKVVEYVRGDGQANYAQYIPGRIGMDGFPQPAKSQIVYRRDVPTDTQTSYLASAPSEEDALEKAIREILKKEGKLTIYDELREKIYQETIAETKPSQAVSYPTRGPGVRQYMNEKDDIITATRAREKALQLEVERQQRYDELRKQLLGPERYKKLKEQLGETTQPASAEKVSFLNTIMTNIFEYLETSVFNFTNFFK